jgi:hypothetical protein
MKHALFIATLISAFLLSSCSKEKQFEKRLYGEWELTSFMHGANDLTQLYKDSCGCRLLFREMKSKDNDCLLKCSFNGWNYYFLDSIANIPWRNDQFSYTFYQISDNGKEICWNFGNAQPEGIYRWGMYPLTIRFNTSSNINMEKCFTIVEFTKENLRLSYIDSTNILYGLSFSKIK